MTARKYANRRAKRRGGRRVVFTVTRRSGWNHYGNRKHITRCRAEHKALGMCVCPP